MRGLGRTACEVAGGNGLLREGGHGGATTEWTEGLANGSRMPLLVPVAPAVPTLPRRCRAKRLAAVRAGCCVKGMLGLTAVVNPSLGPEERAACGGAKVLKCRDAVSGA